MQDLMATDLCITEVNINVSCPQMVAGVMINRTFIIRLIYLLCWYLTSMFKRKLT